MKRFLLFINFILAAAMMIAHLSPFINPNTFWPISFAGILFPYLVIINVLFWVFWLFVKKKYLLISTLFLIICWPSIKKVFSFSVNSKQADSVKIMTYNVKNFDLYNWSKNKDTRDKMLELIEKEDPDILCIQEFFWHPNVENDNLKEILKRLNKPDYYFEEFQYWKGHHWGSAIFSKYPIRNKGEIKVDGSNSNISIFADLDINGSNVRVYNLHLQSIFLAEDDYTYLKDVSDMKKPDAINTLKIIEKMKIAYKKRADQAVQISASLKEYEGTKIICGDFNDTPVSFTYQTIKADLQDAFTKKGFGLGKTFVSKIPSFRIDFILLHENLKVHSYRSINENLSDHYPVIVDFSTSME